MSRQVKWFSSKNFNAPVFSNEFGCIADVLNACLVDGFGSQTILSLIVQDGIGIATFGGTHKIKQFQWVEIAGASDPKLNNEFKVTGLTENTIEFVVNTANQTATGTLTCKLASLGWTKEFSGVNKAVYRAKDTVANPYYLRVDNSQDPVYTATYAKYAKVGILESCSHIDDLTANQVPFDSLNPNKNWIGTGSGASAINGWAKWYHDVSEVAPTQQFAETNIPANNEKEWMVIGDESSFYLVSTPVSSSNVNKHIATYVYSFGVTEKKGFRVPFLLAHQRNVAASSIEFFFNSNPLRYGWAPSTITMTTNTGAYSQDLQAWAQYYLPTRNTSNTTMLSGASAGGFSNLEAGIHFSKIMLHGNNNSFLGAFPLIYSMQSSQASVDELHTFIEDGECFLHKKAAQANLVGGFIFSLGEL